MSKFYTPLLVIIPAFTLVLFAALKGKTEKPAENPSKPIEHFTEVRAWPDKVFDLKAYEEMLQSNSLAMKSSSAQSPGVWQLEGPTNIGGRITCVAASPTNSNVILAGTPAGGIFKTTDGGQTWIPVFDDKPFLYIGDIAYHPTNPNIVYAGTGDPDVPFTVFVGNGMYKSTDGGNTWTHIGLSNAKIITKIIVSPQNPNTIYVAALGNPIQADNHRGVYKSTDGGATWSQVLFVNNQTGVSDMVIDPANDNVVYATSYTCIRNATVNIRVSNDARVYKSTNGGTTWNILQGGLPNYPVNKYGICMSNQNPNKLYVAVCDSLFQMENVYVTNDGGNTFVNLGNNGMAGNYGGFGWYFGEIEVNPINDMEIYIAGIELYKSSNGGANWMLNQPPWWNYVVHADIHAIKMLGPGKYIVGTDGGLYLTTDNGNTYTDIDEIPNTQFYRVAVNPHMPTMYWGGTQDNGTIYGNMSNINNWFREFGGDGFQPRFDPNYANIYYVETQNGGLWSTDDGGFNWMMNTVGIDGTDRRNWDMPIVVQKNNSDVQYTGTYRIYKNVTGAYANWTPISGDLTDGNIYGERFHNISAIDLSEINYQLIYVGTSDANVWRTTNGGAGWTNITGNLPNRYVTSVHASPNNTTNVYVTHTGYKYGSYIPHVHKSTDNGNTWIDISGNLPQSGVNDIVIIPGNENMLFISNDIGVYVTKDGGVNWYRVGNNMPLISVWDIEYNPLTQKLYAGTYSRSLYSINVNQITVAIDEIEKQKPFCKLYPTVVTDNFTVELEQGTNASLRIYDMNGKNIFINERLTPGQNNFSVSSFKNGLYMVEIKSDKGTELKKIIKN